MSEINKVTENKEEVMSIEVDDGSVRVPIKNQLGEVIGEFRFRPTDFNIVKRYNKIAGEFDEVLKPLINANISPEGEGADEESIKILGEAEKKLFELVDYLFDGNASEAFFGKMNPFSPVNGGIFYCENVLESVGQFIAKKFDAEIKGMTARVNKYTHGYKTGKHKNGSR